MATTVHLPRALLERVDERARSLKLSRNQFVRRALDRLLAHETEWSDRFLEALQEAAHDEDGRRAVDDLMRAVARRSRKDPPAL
jgi:metal-responsive CopG/Arc/MetJ family transcriptional regulator